MISFFVAILNGIIWAALRRIYGGAIKTGLLSKRGIQTAIMLLFMFPFMVPSTFLSTFLSTIPDYKTNLAIILGIVYSVYLQFVFWSKGHGPMFDVGTDKKPTSGTIERYEEMWGYKLACKTTPYPRWYGFWFDFKLMFYRYSWPMIPVAVICSSFGMFLAGLTIAPIYAFCWALYREEKWIFNKLPFWCSYPTNLAEILSGFVFGFAIAYDNDIYRFFL